MKKNLIYALCCNLDSTATSGEVRNFLSRRGLPVESVQMMQGTAAIIGVEARDAERLVQSADGANYKSNSLVMLLPQNQDSMNKVGAVLVQWHMKLHQPAFWKCVNRATWIREFHL